MADTPSVTLDELLKEVGIPKASLEKKCSDSHLADISLFLEWRITAPHLGLSATEISAIHQETPTVEDEKRLKALQKWNSKYDFKATYLVLVETFLKIGRAADAQKVCAILKKAPHTRDQHLKMKSDEDNHYKEGPSYKQEASCSGNSVQTSSQLSCTAKSSYQFLDVNTMNKDDRTDLEEELTDRARKMVLEFSKLNNSTRESLKKRNIDPNDLADCVLSISPFRAGIGTKPLLDEHKEEIMKATKVARIFLLIKNYCSFYNYTILEHIITEHGSEDDIANLERYQSEFEKFCRASVFEVPDSVYGHERDDKTRARVTIKLSEDSGIPTLKDVSQVQSKFAKTLNLKPSALHLCTIREGCIELLFLVPEFATRQVFGSPFSEEQKMELHEMSIVKVECNQPQFDWQVEQIPLKNIKGAAFDEQLQVPRHKLALSIKHQAEDCAPEAATSTESYIDEEDFESDDRTDGSSLSDSVCDMDSACEMEYSPNTTVDTGYQSDSPRKGKRKAGGVCVQKSKKSKYEGNPLSPHGSEIGTQVPSMEQFNCRQYLPWKKLYSLYKAGETRARSEVNTIMESMTLDQEAFIFGFARYIPECWQRVEQEQREVVLNTLKKTPQFPFAKAVMGMNGKSAEEDLCGAIPLMVIGSRHVSEVHSLISGLMTRLHPDNLDVVTELFYCLATLFFAFWDAGLLPQRFHYYVFYSLSMLENGSHVEPTSNEVLIQTTFPIQPRMVDTTVSAPAHANSDPSKLNSQKYSQPSTTQFIPGAAASSKPLSMTQPSYKKPKGQTRDKEMKEPINPTPEQLRIIHHRLERGVTVRILALAGTGKTTTLVKFAEANPQWKFLYCAYNRSVKQQAKTKFPSNVVATTLHSLAYKELDVGKQFKYKLSRDINVLRVASYISGQKVTSKHGDLHLYIRGRYILATLNAFVASDDETIMAKHLPSLHSDDRKHIRQDREKYEQKLLSDATDLWEKMSDPTDKCVKITHDGYLKIYQLRHPILDRKYTCLLIDEAQDLTPAQLSILMRQPCAKILVGDKHQQIYSFRGAVNALNSISCTTTFELTQSFRFGPEIAHVASCILAHLKCEKQKSIVGGLLTDGVTGEEEGQVAVIARQNTTLFDEVVHFCRNQSKQIGFAGGAKGYGFDLILDVYRLMKNQKDEIKDSLVKTFKHFATLKNYARDAKDPRLMGKIFICEKYSDEIPSLIDMIKKRKTNMKSAPVVFSTGHKSKGLEFDTVKIADDFLQPKSAEDELDTDEMNLLYVAVTRAKRRLVMSPTLVKLLHEAKEDFVYPHVIEPVGTPVPQVHCPLCGEIREAAVIQFEKLPLKLSSRQIQMPGGILCKHCTSEAVPYMNPVFRKGTGGSSIQGPASESHSEHKMTNAHKSDTAEVATGDPINLKLIDKSTVKQVADIYTDGGVSMHPPSACKHFPDLERTTHSIPEYKLSPESRDNTQTSIQKADEPQLAHLLRFPGRRGKINIVEEISSYYSLLGTVLLKDDNGSKVDTIFRAKNRNSVEITKVIVCDWLAGKGLQPVTWETLIKCLQIMRLVTLIEYIEEVLQ